MYEASHSAGAQHVWAWQRGLAEIPRKQFPRSIFVTSSRRCRYNLSRGNRTCRTRMLRKCYSDLSATSRACRDLGIWRTTRHTDKRKALHRSRPPVDQSGKHVANWKGKLPDTPDTRDILVASSRGCRVGRVCEDVTRMLRGCSEETVSVEFQHNTFGLTSIHDPARFCIARHAILAWRAYATSMTSVCPSVCNVGGL